MNPSNDPADMAELDDAALAALLGQDNPLADEIRLAAAVRRTMLTLQTMDVALPADFEARLLASVRGNTTLLDFLNAGFDGIGRTLIDLINLILGLLPAAPEPVPAV